MFRYIFYKFANFFFTRFFFFLRGSRVEHCPVLGAYYWFNDQSAYVALGWQCSIRDQTGVGHMMTSTLTSGYFCSPGLFFLMINIICVDLDDYAYIINLFQKSNTQLNKCFSSTYYSPTIIWIQAFKQIFRVVRRI